MAERDAHILSYSHLKDFPRAPDALLILRKVASLVKPIMRARGWRVPELAEFYPDQQNLLGLNMNRGQKILLRLRFPTDRTLFLPNEQIIDTMLHELSHNVHGPHDANFHALWNQLREEYEGLIRKGYTGEGFLSQGYRLGGGRIPMHEARRLARLAAEKRKTLSSGSGQRLGGMGPRPGEDIREVIVGAIERRKRTLQGCGNDRVDEKEIREIADTATRNGFRTQAEEDAANEAAIAQALWELVQEDEKAKYGSSYIPPSAERPEGNGGGAFDGQQTGAGSSGSVLPTTAMAPWNKEAEKAKGSSNGPATASQKESVPEKAPVPTAATTRPASPPLSFGWTCEVCTLHNQPKHLSCDACGTERSASASRKLTEQANTRTREVIDLTTSPPPKSTGNAKPTGGAKPAGSAKTTRSAPPPAPSSSGETLWMCSFCGNLMEKMWWTCSVCGRMKDNSR